MTDIYLLHRITMGFLITGCKLTVSKTWRWMSLWRTSCRYLLYHLWGGNSILDIQPKMKKLFSCFPPLFSDSGGSRQDPGSGHEEALPPHHCPPVYQGGWAFSRSPGSVLSTHCSWANPLVRLSLRETETFGLRVDGPPSSAMKRRCLHFGPAV